MSEVRANTIADAAGTGPAALLGQWAARVICNYDMVTTSAVLSSENISSITDNGTGDASLAITNNLAGTTDPAAMSVGRETATDQSANTMYEVAPRSTSSSRWRTVFSSATANSTNDRDENRFAIWGDLA